MQSCTVNINIHLRPFSKMPWSGLPAFFLGLTEAEKTQEVGVLDVQVTCSFFKFWFISQNIKKEQNTSRQTERHF